MPNQFSHFHGTIIVFVIAAAIRLLFLGSMPEGLNPDEALAGYNAWALLQQGIDQYGLSWPVYFAQPSHGQHVFYAYLSMPFIALMELNSTSIRLAAACLGVLSLWLFWRIGKKSSSEMGVWALLVIATSPWHIMASRFALESNALPAIILLGTYGIIRARDNIAWLPLSSAIIATSVYTYDTAYFFAPLFLLCSWAVLNSQKKIPIATLLLSVFCAIAVALPMIAFLINSRIGTGDIHLGLVTIPKHPYDLQYNIFLTLSSESITRIQDNSIQVLGMLLGARDDGLLWNASPTWGPQFWMLTPFLMLGIAFAIREASLIDRLMLLWFVCALAIAFITIATIDRINLLWLPSLWLAGRGLWLFHKKIFITRLAQLVVCCFGLFFSLHYFISWQEKISSNLSPGLGTAIRYLQKQAPENSTIIVTAKSEHASTLFFAQPMPREYLTTVIISDPGTPYQNLLSFGNIHIGINVNEIANNHYWVAHISELSNFDLLAYDIQSFGDYAAVTRKPSSDLNCYQPLQISGFSGQQDYGSIAIHREVGSDLYGLNIADQFFSRGFGVHGNSNWTKDLDNTAELLQFGIGLSQSSTCSDGITFEILLDDKSAYESPMMKPGQLTFVSLELQEAKKISFITKAGISNRCDHGMWLTPIVKHCQN